MENAIMLE